MSNLNSKIISATKWSTVTEFVAKLVQPLTMMVLARLLTPDAFGVLITATMVISFAEIFTDAGFQKYLIQHEFSCDDEKYKSVAVAFWTNLMVSLLIWGVLILFSDPIATCVGSPGYGVVIAISSVCIPLAAFSSIQMALFKRDLDFRTLFIVRIVGVCIPLVVTIPLAFVMRSYWALIIGMIALNLSNAFILTVKSKWKPNRYYSMEKLREMFSFTVWSMIESISIWLTAYVDVFIVGIILNQHYLGIYRTSTSLVAQLTGVITAATTPILFSSLSRLQNSESEFRAMFFRFQKLVGLLVIPIGVGVFLFSDLITSIALGDQWGEAARFVGFWGLSSAIVIVLSHYSSEVYRAKGRPKLSVLAQWLHIIVLWPVVMISSKYGFDVLCGARALVRVELVLVNLCIMGLLLNMPVGKMITNILPACVASSAMLFVLFLPQDVDFWLRLGYVLLAVVLYGSVVLFFPKERNILLNIRKYIKK